MYLVCVCVFKSDMIKNMFVCVCVRFRAEKKMIQLTERKERETCSKTFPLYLTISLSCLPIYIFTYCCCQKDILINLMKCGYFESNGENSVIHEKERIKATLEQQNKDLV